MSPTEKKTIEDNTRWACANEIDDIILGPWSGPLCWSVTVNSVKRLQAENDRLRAELKNSRAALDISGHTVK